MNPSRVYNHSIKHQEFDIVLGAEENAFEIQSEISSMQNTWIETIINKVLDEFSNDLNIFRFDRIELDLGSVLEDNMHQEIPLKIEEALTQYLRNVFRGEQSSSIMETIEINDNLLEQLEHFLQYGYFNWNTYNNATATSIFNNLKTEYSDALKQLLRKLGKAENMRKRIINQFMDSTIESIVEVVAEEESAYVLEYRKAIINHQQKERIVESESNVFRDALWEIILAYVFLESNSYYNRKNYLSYLIKKIAEKYNQTYSSLLLAIYEGVDNSNLTYRGSKNEFKKIVIELKKEDKSDEVISEENILLQLESREQVEEILKTIFISKSSLSSISIDKGQLLRLIFVYLQKDPVFIQFIEKTILNSNIVKAEFLSFLDVKTFELLFLKIANENAQINLNIFEVLYERLSDLPSQFNTYFLELYHQRKYFYLSQLSHFSGSSAKLIHFVLDHISLHIPSQKNEVLIWLNTSLSSFSGVDKRIVSNYIKQRFEYEKLDHISLEIKTFITSNESETWYYWIFSKYKQWLESTNLNTSDWQLIVSNNLKKDLSKDDHDKLLQIFKLVASEQIEWVDSSFAIFPASFQPIKSTTPKRHEQKFIEYLCEQLGKAINKISLETHFSDNWYIQTLQLIIEASESFSIDSNLLIKEVHVYFTQTKPNELVSWRIEKLLDESFSDTLHKTSKSNLETEYVENCEFIIKKGILPWWNTSYTWFTFNLEFAKCLQNTDTEKRIELAFNKSKESTYIFSQLNLSNQNAFFNKVLLRRVTSSLKKCVKELYDFVSVKALLYGTIPPKYYLDFRHQFITVFLTKSPSIAGFENRIITYIGQLLKHISDPQSFDAVSIFNLLEKWGNSNIKKLIGIHPYLEKKMASYNLYYGRNTVSNLLRIISISNSNELKEILSDEKLFLLVLQSVEVRKLLINKLTSNDLKALFSNISKSKYFENLKKSMEDKQVYSNVGTNQLNVELFEDLISQFFQSKSFIQEMKVLNGNTQLSWMQQLIKLDKLRSILTSQSEHKESIVPFLFYCFENDDTRSLLIEELSFQELETLAQNNLSSNQTQFFDKALIILNFYFGYLSSQERKQLSKFFFGLVLSKVASKSTLQSWRIEDWVWLVSHSLESTIGRNKKNQLLVTIFNEKSHQFQAQKELRIFLEISRESDSIQSLLHVINAKDEKAYRKLGEEVPKVLLNPIYIKNAGLVIMSPYLKMLFDKCNLLNEIGEFKDVHAKYKAMHLLEFAALGFNEYHEHDLVINKVLCGLELTETIEHKTPLTEAEKDIVNSLLNAVIMQWSALQNTSVAGLRESFLQRNGRLAEEDEQYYLKVEKKAFDMLLDQIPWNISTINLSWMKKILIVEWR